MIEKTLAERIDSWMGFYQEEAVRFNQMYFEKSVQHFDLEEIIQYSGFSISLEVASKGLANIRMRHALGTEDDLKQAIQEEIAGLQYCIELDTKHWIAPTRKPWVKHTDILKAQAKVSKYRDIIDELTLLIS